MRSWGHQGQAAPGSLPSARGWQVGAWWALGGAEGPSPQQHPRLILSLVGWGPSSPCPTPAQKPFHGRAGSERITILVQGAPTLAGLHAQDQVLPHKLTEPLLVGQLPGRLPGGDTVFGFVGLPVFPVKCLLYGVHRLLIHPGCITLLKILFRKQRSWHLVPSLHGR